MGITSFETRTFSSKIIKENEVLIKFCDNPEIYIELKNIKTFLDIYSKINKDGISLSNIFLDTLPSDLEDAFIDRRSLKPYYNETGQVKIKQLKKDVLINSRTKQ